MQFTAAYDALGYKLENHRTDWSAEKPGGVCISIWKSEMEGVDSKAPVFDYFRLYPGGGGSWTKRIGHKKRTKHVSKALRDFDGYVDVIVLAGHPESGFGDAEPWRPEGKGGRVWRVTRFDPKSGFFRAEVTTRKEGPA